MNPSQQHLPFASTGAHHYRRIVRFGKLGLRLGVVRARSAPNKRIPTLSRGFFVGLGHRPPATRSVPNGWGRLVTSPGVRLAPTSARHKRPQEGAICTCLRRCAGCGAARRRPKRPPSESTHRRTRTRRSEQFALTSPTSALRMIAISPRKRLLMSIPSGDPESPTQRSGSQGRHRGTLAHITPVGAQAEAAASACTRASCQQVQANPPGGLAGVDSFVRRRHHSPHPSSSPYSRGT